MSKDGKKNSKTAPEQGSNPGALDDFTARASASITRTMTGEMEPEADISPIPEGFELLGGLGLDGWIRPYPGCTVRGVILDRVQRAPDEETGKVGHVYHVRLTSPARAVDANGDSILAPVDAVVGLDERWALERLSQYRGEVFVRFVEQIPTGRGKSVWRTQVAIPRGAALTSSPQLPPAAPQEPAAPQLPPAN